MSEHEPDSPQPAAEDEVDLDQVDLDQISRNLKILERTVPVQQRSYNPRRADLERAAFPRFVAWLGPRGVPDGPDAHTQLQADATAVVEAAAKQLDKKADGSVTPFTDEDVKHVARVIVNDVTGDGPLHDHLRDDRVSEIMVNGPGKILIERGGRIELTEACFRDEAHLTHHIRKIAERIDRRIDFKNPCLDGRLPDGSRVHAVLPPVAVDGPLLTIRKFGVGYKQIEDLIHSNTLRPEMAFFLGACVKARLNIAIGGPSSSGKTTTLNVLASQVPAHERMVTIEELTELDLGSAHGNVVRLQTRTDNTEGVGLVSIRQLVREALRMRADRIVVGEARGDEMLEVLQAMRCGHDGSMTTIHATSPDDVIERAVTISLFGHLGLGEDTLRRLVVDALDVIVLLTRFADGTRKVVRITEPYRDPDTGRTCFNDVFTFDHTGYEGSRPTGAFRWAGATRHAERFHRMGIDLPESVLGELT